MNTSYKCNCCLKESVCKFKAEYEQDCAQLPQNVIGKTTELSIVCMEFAPKENQLLKSREAKEILS